MSGRNTERNRSTSSAGGLGTLRPITGGTTGVLYSNGLTLRTGTASTCVIACFSIPSRPDPGRRHGRLRALQTGVKLASALGPESRAAGLRAWLGLLGALYPDAAVDASTGCT